MLNSVDSFQFGEQCSKCNISLISNSKNYIKNKHGRADIYKMHIRLEKIIINSRKL